MWNKYYFRRGAGEKAVTEINRGGLGLPNWKNFQLLQADEMSPFEIEKRFYSTWLVQFGNVCEQKD